MATSFNRLEALPAHTRRTVDAALSEKGEEGPARECQHPSCRDLVCVFGERPSCRKWAAHAACPAPSGCYPCRQDCVYVLAMLYCLPWKLALFCVTIFLAMRLQGASSPPGYGHHGQRRCPSLVVTTNDRESLQHSLSFVATSPPAYVMCMRACVCARVYARVCMLACVCVLFGGY